MTLMPIFHRKLGLRWLQTAKEINTKNMKCTCPTPAPTPGTQRHLYSTGNWVCVCYPTRRNLHTKNEMYMADARNWRHLTQKIHVRILALGDAEVLFLALGDAKVPGARYFAFWWNIGLRIGTAVCSVNCSTRSFRWLCNYTFQLTLYFLLISDVN